MARVTVFIPDDLLDAAAERMVKDTDRWPTLKGTSHLVQEALREFSEAPSRPEASERGRLETLRAVRAAVAALGDVEATLTQSRPVKRRVRRSQPSRRA